MSLTADQISALAEQLRTERVRILSNITALRAEFGETMTGESGENGLESHIGDQGTVMFLRARDIGIEEHEEQLLGEIDAALARIDAGTYGVCDTSGEEIAFERLEAYPWARTRIEHAPA